MEILWRLDKDGSKRQVVEITCETCGDIFCRRLNGTQRFCSVKCRGLGTRDRIKLNCSNCGNEFECKPSRKTSSKHGYYFCSQKCHNAAQCVNSGIQMIRPSHYVDGRFAYRRTCKEMLQNGCCCGEKRLYLLVIHHIDGNRKNNKQENLEAVCGNCHILRHLKMVDGIWQFDSKALTPREKIIELMG